MTTNDRDVQDELDQANDVMKQMAAEQDLSTREHKRAERRHRRARGPRGRDNVVSCRLDDSTLEAVDTLVEAGVRATRADAVTWLIEVGLEANRELINELGDTVAQIRRLRQDAANRAQSRTGDTESQRDSDRDADGEA